MVQKVIYVWIEFVTRNVVAGATTKGETELPEPSLFYKLEAEKLSQKAYQTKDKTEKVKYRNQSNVLITISEWYENDEVLEKIGLKIWNNLQQNKSKRIGINFVTWLRIHLMVHD